MAWIAFQIQQEAIAPAVLFPLAAGAALGALLVAAHRYTARPRRRTAIFLAIVWGLLLVVAQDYIGHRYRLRQFDAEVVAAHPLAAALVHQSDVRPTFARHVSDRFRARPGWWTLDLVLTASAAAP